MRFPTEAVKKMGLTVSDAFHLLVRGAEEKVLPFEALNPTPNPSQR